MERKYKKKVFKQFGNWQAWYSVKRKLEAIAEESLDRYYHKDGYCFKEMGPFKKPERITDCKRISGSLIHNAIMGLSLEKSRGQEGRESEVRESFILKYKLAERNFIEEVIVTRKRYPLFAGRLDGLLKTKGGHIVVEFKGFLRERVVFYPTKSFKVQHPAIQQLFFYLFLLNWPDGMLVYGYKNHKTGDEFLRITTIQPHRAMNLRREFEKLAENEFLEIFSKQIFVWKLLKFSQITVADELKPTVRDNISWLVEIIKKFARKKKKNSKNIAWPELKEIKRNFLTLSKF